MIPTRRKSSITNTNYQCRAIQVIWTQIRRYYYVISTCWSLSSTGKKRVWEASAIFYCRRKKLWICRTWRQSFSFVTYFHFISYVHLTIQKFKELLCTTVLPPSLLQASTASILSYSSSTSKLSIFKNSKLMNCFGKTQKSQLLLSQAQLESWKR